MMYAVVAAALAIINLLPRLTTAVPSPLVAIVVLTLVSLMTSAPDDRCLYAGGVSVTGIGRHCGQIRTALNTSARRRLADRPVSR